MHASTTRSYSCFDGLRRIASGAFAEVSPVCRRAMAHPEPGPVLLFDDTTGRPIDIDPREPEDRPPEPVQQSDAAAVSPAPTDPPRGRGRPKLGVVAREVTLLPRHWDWLASQSGGASVVLRKLVDQARRNDTDDSRQRHERAYQFMMAIAGNRPGFEEAIRALFANDLARLQDQIAAWPQDVRAHALRLATGETGRREGAACAHGSDDKAGDRVVTS